MSQRRNSRQLTRIDQLQRSLYQRLGPLAYRIAPVIASYAWNTGKRALVNRLASQDSLVSGNKRQKTSTTSSPPSTNQVMAWGGHTAGRFRKPKRKYGPKAQKRFAWGFRRRVETGSTNNSPDCSYVGHGVAMNEVVHGMAAAIVIKLAQKAGQTVQQLNDRWRGWDGQAAVTVNVALIRVTYRKDAEGPIQIKDFDVAADASFGNTADLLKNWFYDTAANGFLVGANEPMMLEIMLFPLDAASNRSIMPASKLDLTRAMIDYNIISTICLQNRTTSSTAGTDDHTSIDDVTNNPLHGKCYTGKGTGVRLRHHDSTTQVPYPLVANNTTGAISFDLEHPAVTAQMQNSLRRPPTKEAFTNVSKVGFVNLAPGAIKKSSFRLNGSISVKRLTNMLFSKFTSGPAQTDQYNFGKFELFAMQKTCNTQVNEPNIVLGFELNQHYAFKLRMGTSGIIKQMSTPAATTAL